MNVTLCGCLRFTDREYEWDRTQRQVGRHYRAHTECRARALQHPVWLAREPIGDKRNPGAEHDPEYDREEFGR